jgi:alanyl-tRNA synthetase
VLGGHVQQKGSLVDPAKTRFDFSHHSPMTAAQIAQVEALVNAQVLANAATQAQVMGFDDAVAGGAMALFGEKYGDTVRVLDIGNSRELCGGTHVGRTGDIGLFKIVAEGGVAAGVRRVEAVTGDNALQWVQGLESMVGGAAAAFKAPLSELPAKIEQLMEAHRAAEKELDRLKSKLAASQGDELVGRAIELAGGVRLLTASLPGADAKVLRETMDKLKDKLRSAVIVLAAPGDGKVQLAAGVTADQVGKVKAGELVNFVAQQVGGKGGGKPDMAMAGGTDAAALPAALASVQAWVSERI